MNWTKALMAPFRFVGSSVKALAMTWSGQMRSWWSVILPRTDFDYAKEIGDGSKSNIVVACVNWMARTFPEAPLMVFEERPDGTREKRVGHPMAEKVERPNPFYSGVLMWMATIVDWNTSGNAYWLKVRSASGEVVQLWWAPSFTMEPKWPQDGQTFISHYEYKPDPARQPIPIEPRNVVHFRYNIDPLNVRKGLSPLRSLMREIFTDEEAANFTAALMRNLGVPGVVIAPEGAEAKPPTKEVADDIKDKFKATFGGDKRGEPMVMSGPTKVSVLSFSPEQMNLRDLRRIPEERTTAVFGVAAVVVGLGAGLDRATFTNFGEAREAAYEGNMIPTQRLMAADLRIQLLPDFEESRTANVGFDLTYVRVLQPDANSKIERLNKMVNGGWMQVSVAQREADMPVDEGQEVYLRPMNVLETRTGEARPSLPGQNGQKAVKGAGFPEQMGLIRARLAERFTPPLVEFFEGQARRVLGRLPKGIKAAFNVNQLLPDAEDDLLAEALRPLWLTAMGEGWKTAGSSFGLEGEFDDGNVHVITSVAQAPARARRINDGTRKTVAEAFDLGESRGYTLDQVIDGVPADDFAGIGARVEEYYRDRPGSIALTEAMWATNAGAASLYRKSGMQMVQMIDNPAHEPCASRNGRVVTIDAGMAATGSEHPNGTLSLVPVT
ncbi:hypothetical protein LCGC14_1278670 [marine sediment metagenome]|uniref:Phage portal protein n=1 Tax=marine sediment metagenome TaxID=412755 RepID=A0A0F9LH58_9ZZZZ